MRKLLAFLLLAFALSVPVKAQVAITGFAPTNIPAGTGDTTLTIYGQNFQPMGCTAYWSGTALATTYAASNTLTTLIPGALVANVGAAQISVSCPPSNSIPVVFQITSPAATVYSYSPTVFTAGQDTVLTVVGQDFQQNATVYFDWFPLVTTFIDPGNLQAALPGANIVGNGPHHVLVYNATPPPAQASLSLPNQINFGAVVSGDTLVVEFFITNISQLNVTLGNPHLTAGGINPDDFTDAGTGTCTDNQLLLPGTTCTVDLQFFPSVLGFETASLAINSNGTGSPQFMALSGGGAPVAAGQASLSPTAVSFGAQQQTVASNPITSTFSNSGNAPLTISAISLTGTNSADFSLGGTCTNSTVLQPGDSCTLQAIFTPSTTSTESALISVTDDAVGSPHLIGLTGTGATTSSHNSTIAWTSSPSSSITGYNVYRGTQNCGPYALLTPSPINDVSYVDFQVSSGSTYFYVVTAVGSNPPYATLESIKSSQVSSTIP